MGRLGALLGRSWAMTWAGATGWVLWATYLGVISLLCHTAVFPGAHRSSEVLAHFFLMCAGVSAIWTMVAVAIKVPQDLASGQWDQLRLLGISRQAYLCGQLLTTLFTLLLYLCSTLVCIALIARHGTLNMGHVAAGYAGVFGGCVVTTCASLWAAVITRRAVATCLVSALMVLPCLLPLASISHPPFDAFFAGLHLPSLLLDQTARGYISLGQLSLLIALSTPTFLGACLGLEGPP